MAITIIQPLALGNINNENIPIWPYNEVDSATYKVGAPMVVSAGAELTEATSGSPPLTGVVGITLQAGQNIATAPEYPNYGITPTSSGVDFAGPLLIAMAMPGVIFEGTLCNAGADYVVGSDGSNVFVKYGLTKDSTSGYWYVDEGLTTTNANVLVIGIKNVQDVVLGTTKGVRVYFVFLQDGTLYTTQA
jgi:hypothetical protein